jgi:thiol-disulfide isomerase/thioredoxin
VFSSCSPTYAFIIATVFPLSLFEGLLYTTIYALWVGTLFLIVALFGQKVIAKLRFFADEKWFFHKIIGFIFLLVGIAIITWFDKKVEARILDTFNVSFIEQSIFEKLNPEKEIQKQEETSLDEEKMEKALDLIEAEINNWGDFSQQNTNSSELPTKKETPKIVPTKSIDSSTKEIIPIKPTSPSSSKNWDDTSIEQEIDAILKDIGNPETSNLKKAPEINLTNWVQWSPTTMSELKGKVVLINFWTLGCINCKNTLSHVISWDKTYKDKGLVIIWVHAPEFAYEKKKENVEEAVKEHGIEYRIVMDNDFNLWKSYANRYWPAFYFIDKKWNIRGSHFGEWSYDKNEKLIQSLLAET